MNWTPKKNDIVHITISNTEFEICSDYEKIPGNKRKVLHNYYSNSQYIYGDSKKDIRTNHKLWTYNLLESVKARLDRK